MAEVIPYDESPPRRPGIDDVGGGNKEDDAEFPPDPNSMATAKDFNIMGGLDVAHGKVVPWAVISVVFSGGTPSVGKLSCLSSSIVAGNLTVTDNGDGDTSIEWAAGTFPSSANAPSGLTLNDDVEIDRQRAYAITNGVRVKTKLGATGTDCAFTVEIH